MRSKNTLRLPRPETNYIRNSVSYRGTVLWNSLDHKIRTEKTLGALKSLIKKSKIQNLTFQDSISSRIATIIITNLALRWLHRVFLAARVLGTKMAHGKTKQTWLP